MAFEPSSKLRSLFPDVRYPIIQAPMAGTATPELAAAVSNSGGLGSLGIGTSTTEQAREMILATQSLTDKPFNMNLFCHQPPVRNSQQESEWLTSLAPLFQEVGAELPDSLDVPFQTFLDDEATFQMLLETRPRVISFHFGLPSPENIVAFKSAGITLLATATNVSEARVIESAGIDAIVAQGVEAGGHRGVFDPAADDQRLPTSVLVQQLVRNVDIPIIAAGGVMNGAGIRAMLNLGAVAAQMGTAFVLCPESAANDSYRVSLKSDRTYRTRHTRVFTGREARAIVNQLIEINDAPGASIAPAYPLPTLVTRSLGAAALEKGSTDFSSHWAGQGAPLAREMPAAELIATLVNEMEG